LIVACGAYAQSPNPSPKATGQPIRIQNDEQGTESQTNARQPTPIEQQGQPPHRKEKVADDNGQTDPALELNRLLTLYTGQLAQYTWLLVGVGLLQFVVAAFGVFLLFKSFGLTKLALQSDRPFVLPVMVIPVPSAFVPEGIGICRIKNFGKGPAIVVEIVARLKATDRPFPLPAEFSDCLPVTMIEREVIGASESITFWATYSGSNQDISDAVDATFDTLMIQGAKRLTLYGEIRYRDVFNNSYSTWFGFLYLAKGATLDGKAIYLNLFANGKDYNRSS